MGIVDGKFRSKRLDQSPYLFHFTKGTLAEAGEAMFNIIGSEKLLSEKGYICFRASPITALEKFFKTPTYRTGLPMYQPIGIGFSRDILVKDYGVRNVIYCNKKELEEIPEHLRWRSQRLEVDEYDFEYLREWRMEGNEFNFSSFPKEHILIIAPTQNDLNNFIVKHEMVFKPIVDYYNGDIEPDWDEEFVRKYKGISLNVALSKADDYAVSGSTASQVLGQDMVNELFGINLFVSESKTIVNK